MKRYLQAFLENIPQQKSFDYTEIILAHNEPDQEEIAWVNNFQKKHPNKLKHLIFNNVTPLGVSWNQCIKQATGKFLTIWNIDDIRTKNSIELQAKTLIENNNIDFVYGNFHTTNKFGNLSGELIKCDNIPQPELTRSMVLGPFFMFRKKILQKTGYFDEQFKSAVDFDFAIRLALHGQAMHIPWSLGYFLNEGKGLSTKTSSRNDIERTAIELRYGIYDKMDYNFLPEATSQYNILNILQQNKLYHVSKFVPQYEDFIQKRKKMWFNKGIKRFYTLYKKQNNIIQKIRTILKPI